MRSPGINHVAVLCHGLPGMLAFYRDVLGLEVQRLWHEPDGAVRSVWLSLDGAFIALERSTAVGSHMAGGPGWHCVALDIPLEERQAWKDRLTMHNVPITRETDFSIFFTDPEGNLLALSHHPFTLPPR